MQTFDEFWQDISIYKLEIVHPYYKLSDTFDCANGCGSKGGIDFPDSFFGLSIESACNNHDIEWELSKNYQGLIEANHRFRINMEKIIDLKSNWLMKRIRYHFMNRYYTEVKLLGSPKYAEDRGFV